MTRSDELSSFTLAEIIQRCQEQTSRFIHQQLSNGRYCFELFRLALVEKHQQAWEAVYQQYMPQVLKWLQKGNRLLQVEEGAEELVNETFAKFWKAVTVEKFASFPTLQALLDYLKLCAGSVIVDKLRRKRLPNDELQEESAAGNPTEESIQELDKHKLFQLINQRLKDEDERLLFFAMFTLGMKPSEICAEWPNRFASVQRVNQVRQNIVTRLQNDQDLRRFYSA